MAPHEVLPEEVTMTNGIPFKLARKASTKDQKSVELPVPAILPPDYWVSFNNIDGSTPLTVDEDVPYKVAEHILWAPRKIRVACIGAGAAGIMFCYKKEREFGDDIDLVVYDRYAAVGGVWVANKYPGCRCDVPSAGYQYSFAPSAEWPKYYSSASEIQKYYANFASKNGYIEKYIKLRHEVKKAQWIEGRGVWQLSITETLSSGETRDFEDEVEFLIGNIGVLNTWKWPDIPNRELFKGQITHSADYDLSIDLVGKRVAVIGSGASSLQIVPEVQKVASELISFYRTPQWVFAGLSIEGYTDPLGKNFTYTDEQKQLFRDNPKAYLSFRKQIESKINASFRGNLRDHPFQTVGRKMAEEHMHRTLNNSPALIAKLVPTFPMGCRRLGPGEGFLEALQAPNTTIASGDIVSFTTTGLKTTTGDYDADVIICATGFDVSFRPYFPIIGRGGVSLAERWTPDPEAYLAMCADGFPNFILGSLGPNCPAGHGSFVSVLESASNYMIQVIRKLQTENIHSISISAAAVREYNEHVHEWLKRTVWTSGCRSWYNQGRPDGKVTAQYPGSLVHWREMLREVRWEDFEIRYRARNRFQFMGNGFTRREVEGGDLAWYLDDEEVERRVLSH